MKIKCEYCGSWIDESDVRCPNCNAVNTYFKRQGNDVPRTIEQLKHANETAIHKIRLF